MNKHTPGPWSVAHSLSGKVFVTIEHNIGMAHRQVCEIMPDITMGDFEANAYLIAAAPELLEAAQKALDDCVDLIATEAGIALGNAIAKAKGEK